MTYVVVHEGGSLKENTRVIRELGLVDIGTVLSYMTTIINLVCGGVKETNALHPVPGLLSPVGVSRVTGVSSKSSTQVKETTVSDTFLRVSMRVH